TDRGACATWAMLDLERRVGVRVAICGNRRMGTGAGGRGRSRWLGRSATEVGDRRAWGGIHDLRARHCVLGSCGQIVSDSPDAKSDESAGNSEHTGVADEAGEYC